MKHEEIEVAQPAKSDHLRTILYIEDNKSNQLRVKTALSRDPTITLVLADDGRPV